MTRRRRQASPPARRVVAHLDSCPTRTTWQEQPDGTWLCCCCGRERGAWTELRDPRDLEDPT